MESSLSRWKVSWPSIWVRVKKLKILRTRCPVPMANGSVRVSNGDCHFFAQVHNNLVRYHADPLTRRLQWRHMKCQNHCGQWYKVFQLYFSDLRQEDFMDQPGTFKYNYGWEYNYKLAGSSFETIKENRILNRTISSFQCRFSAREVDQLRIFFHQIRKISSTFCPCRPGKSGPDVN